MTNSFYPKNFEDYKNVLRVIDDTEQRLRTYIKDVVKDGYSSVENVIFNIIEDFSKNYSEINSNNSQYQEYIDKQLVFLENAVNIIKTNKCENLSAYQTLEDINKTFLNRIELYKNINRYKEKSSGMFYEVKSFLSHSIKYYEIKYSKNETRYLNQCFDILKENDSPQLIRILHTIKTDIFMTDFENFYVIYKNVISDINRKNAENRLEALSNIIIEDKKYLSDTLDLLATFELSFINFSENDMLSIKVLSSEVVDMYSLVKNEFSKISDKEIIEPLFAKTKSEAGFKSMIDKNSLSIISEEQAFINFTNFVNDIENNLKLLKTSLTGFFIKNADLTIDVVFAYDLMDIFNKINIYIDNMHLDENELDSKTKSIILGIDQTIKIKLINIQESVIKLEDDVRENGMDMDKNVFSKIKSDLFDIHIYKDIDDLLKIEEIHNLLEPWQDKNIFTKPESLFLDNLINNLKKDCLLHEISTFEEIINHSVFILRQNENETIKCFVEFIDKANTEIDKIIERQNIIKIYPDIYNKFDSKEHKVIIAEKKDGFSKGQIIKVINSGYKENDSVLIKANVICAS